MNAFPLLLQDAERYQRFDGVTSFVGEDASGSFGLRANHERFMTSLIFGLARFRLGDDGPWRYLAAPGALLYFVDNTLSVCTRRYLLDPDYERISAALSKQLLAEEEALRGMKRNLHRMEEEILRRVSQMHRTGEATP